MAGESRPSPSPPPTNSLHVPPFLTMPPKRRRSGATKQTPKQTVRDEEDEVEQIEGDNEYESEQDAPPTTARPSSGRSRAAVLNKKDDKSVGQDELRPTMAVVEDAEESRRPSASTSNVPSSVNSDDGADGKRSTLKVRLKMTQGRGGRNSSSSSGALGGQEGREEEDELDDEDEERVDEDEDEDEDDSSDEDDEPSPTKSSAPLTARQAALAGVSTNAPKEGKFDHLSLDALLQQTNNRRKGPQKTEEEIMAKKHEAAKRRKQAMIQKTADDKKDAVDRLLKRQAPRPRARRFDSGNVTPSIQFPPSGGETPVMNIGDDDMQSNSGETSGSGADVPPPPPPPTTYRWISTSRAGAGGGLVQEIEESSEGNGVVPVQQSVSSGMDVDEKGPPEAAGAPAVPDVPKFALSFSIPPSVVIQSLSSASLNCTDELSSTNTPARHSAIASTTCGVQGCTNLCKYRIPGATSDMTGACGLDHFRALKRLRVG